MPVCYKGRGGALYVNQRSIEYLWCAKYNYIKGKG